jgi:hypothetical protein
MKIKSTDIITNREKLNKDIMRYWGIIRTENVIDKNATRNYDLKSLLNAITDCANKRIETKLDSMAINLGFATRSDFPKDSIYPIIYTLSEKNEYFVQLGLIPTINPGLKTKLGKKKLYKTEELTADYINKLKNNLQLEINSLKKKLEDFNSKAELDISTAYLYLTA